MNETERHGTPLSRSLKVAGAYLLAGALWTLFSDAAVERLASDPTTAYQLQTWKGWAFVAVTASVLFLVMLHQFRRDRNRLQLQRGQQEEILRLSQFQKTVIDNANIWLNVLDRDGNVLVWNRAAEYISGYTSDEVTGSDRIWQELYPDAAYFAWVTERVRGVLTGREEVEGLETRIRTRHNGDRLIAWNSRALTDSRGEIAGSIAIGIDITEQKATEQALRARQRQLANFMDNLPGMAYRCLYDEYWTMKFVSSGCRDLTGYEPEDLVDNREVAWVDLIEVEDMGEVTRRVEEAIASATAFSLEYQLHRADGRTIWVWERGRGVEEDGGLVLEGIILDITGRKQLEQRLSQLASLDPLTGQFNRREAERILEEEVARAERFGRQLGVLWVDLDHFKEVNDSWGHAVGDEVLRTVSLRLADSVRSMDTLGRYGGEEFIVIVPEMAVEDARDTAERLRRRVADQPVVTAAGQSLVLTVSIGVAVYPDHADTVEALCKRADQAMYLAKERGRNQTAVFSEASGDSAPALSDGA